MSEYFVTCLLDNCEPNLSNIYNISSQEDLNTLYELRSQEYEKCFDEMKNLDKDELYARIKPYMVEEELKLYRTRDSACEALLVMLRKEIKNRNHVHVNK